MLNFTVDGQKLTRIDKSLVASNSQNYLKCKFSFLSEEWNRDGINVYAQFKNIYTDESYKVVIGSNGECSVPVEINNDFSITLYSIIGTNVLITTNRVTVPVIDNDYSDNAQNSSEATVSIVEGIVSKYMLDNYGQTDQKISVTFETNPINFTTEL